MQRILLFLLTNIAIMVILSITLRILGVDSLLMQNGSDLNINALVIFSGVFGFGGAFISLAISKWMAKRMTGAKVISSPSNNIEKWLIETVENQSKTVGIKMPEVAIFPSNQMNAFATGASKNNALVAVSQGLLDNMTQGEIEAVLGHEISHVANGDMVTLTLIQGVLNTFVYFFARLVAQMINRGNNNAFVYLMTVMAFQAIFGVLASIIVMAFSRYREFRADAGGANLAGRQKMIGALQRLQGNQAESQLDGQLTAFGISGKPAFAELFMTHPPLARRIAALQGK